MLDVLRLVWFDLKHEIYPVTGWFGVQAPGLGVHAQGRDRWRLVD